MPCFYFSPRTLYLPLVLYHGSWRTGPLPCHISRSFATEQCRPERVETGVAPYPFPADSSLLLPNPFISNQGRVRRAGRAALRRGRRRLLSRADGQLLTGISPCAHVPPPSRSRPSGGPATRARGS